MSDHNDDRVRLDRWLWAARFYKTRSLAAQAIAGGKVEVDGERVKRAGPVQRGEVIHLRHGAYHRTGVVRELSARRGPATEAAGMYQETGESRAGREALALQLKALHQAFGPEKGRPTKKERREIDRLKGR